MSGEVITTLVSMFALLFAVIGSHFQTMGRIDQQSRRISDLIKVMPGHASDRQMHR